jgi:hypothetical protein
MKTGGSACHKHSHEDRWFCLTPAFMLVSCSAYSSTLKMEDICFSETLVKFRRTVRRYIPEESTLQYEFNFALPLTVRIFETLTEIPKAKLNRNCSTSDCEIT